MPWDSLSLLFCNSIQTTNLLFTSEAFFYHFHWTSNKPDMIEIWDFPKVCLVSRFIILAEHLLFPVCWSLILVTVTIDILVVTVVNNVAGVGSIASVVVANEAPFIAYCNVVGLEQAALVPTPTPTGWPVSSRRTLPSSAAEETRCRRYRTFNKFLNVGNELERLPVASRSILV
jgi:hypothetical protein